MGAELKRLGEDLILRGDVAGGMILTALAPAMVEAKLIRPSLDDYAESPKAQGRKPGPATFNVDPGRLRELRIERNLSQRTLAHQAAISVSFVSTIERGKHSGISQESARRLASGLGIEASELRREEPIR